MNTNKIVTTGLAALIVLTGAFGVTACSSDTGGQSTSQSQAAQTIDVAEDLENARQAVLKALEDKAWAQVMLASDVDAPTVKYGLLVMPYTYSEATKRVQGTIAIDGGKFTIDAVSAATGKTWQIDQDGKIIEVTK